MRIKNNISIHNKGQAQIHIFPGYIAIRHPFSAGIHTDPPKRGKVREFSAKSRKRFICSLLSLHRQPTHFVTLTYPNDYPSPKEAKDHLHHFAVLLVQSFPKCWFFWKIEPQKRGAPHFHLVGDFGEDWPIFKLRAWVAATWFRVVGSGDIRHLKAGTSVDPVTTHRRLVSYLVKYVSKPQGHHDWEDPGRFWGKINSANIPSVSGVLIHLARGEVIAFKRLIRRWLKARAPRYSKVFSSLLSATVYIPVDVVERMLRWITQEPITLELGGYT